MYDVIVVGAGPAGLAAGMYCARRELKTLIISTDLGGQAALTDWIENYPGINRTIHGADLMGEFLAQATKFGAEFQIGSVREALAQEDGTFVIKSSVGEFTSTAIILAFGLSPRTLGVPGEEEFKNKGVSYCVTCDGPLYKGKDTAVVGNATHALDAVEFLSKVSPRVYWMTRGKEILGDKHLLQHVTSLSNVERVDEEVIRIEGDERVSAIVTKGSTVPASGVFIELGYRSNTKWIETLVNLDGKRQIQIGSANQTSRPGVFAAGDITNIDYKQVVVSAGEGAKAALEAYKYVTTKKLGKQVTVIEPDWGSNKN